MSYGVRRFKASSVGEAGLPIRNPHEIIGRWRCDTFSHRRRFKLECRSTQYKYYCMAVNLQKHLLLEGDVCYNRVVNF